jgi:F-type H+-transporting ATPase subunit a
MTALWATMIIILVVGAFIRLNLNLKPTKTQLVFEIIINFFKEKLTVANQGSSKDTNIFLPLVLTVFFLFLVGNQFSLLPIISGLTYNGLPLFRTPSSDFSLTLAATILVVGLSHLIVISRSPIKHFFNFIKVDQIFKIRKLKDIPNVFLELFLGLMDIVGEVAKVVSMSARLFGNVAAGELMIIVIGGLAVFTAFIVPIPFVFLSSFSGLVQAFVFGLLAVQFSALTLNSIKESK